MRNLVSVQGQLYKQLCDNAVANNDEQQVVIDVHARAAASNRTQYIIKREELTLLESLQPSDDESPADDDPGSGEMSLLKAVRELDPANDDQWTEGGKPAIKAVEAIYGQKVTRKDIEAVASDVTRESAAAELVTE